jgi:hypothetical protein
MSLFILLVSIPLTTNAESPSSSSKTESQSKSWVLTEGTTPTTGARSTLLINTSLLGLGLYGPSVLLALTNDFNEDITRFPVLGYFLTVGGSYLIPSLLYNDDEVTWSMTDLAHSGFLRGILYGGLISMMITDNDTFPYLSSLFSIAEGSLGLYFAKKYKMTSGETHTLSISHDIGILSALSIIPSTLSSSMSQETYAGMILGFGGLGLLGGHFYSKARTHSWGDAELIRLSGLVGMTTILPILSTANIDNVHVGSALFLSGLIGGVAISDYFIKDLDFTPSEALITDVLTICGFFGGIALAYLVQPEAESETPYLWGGSLGALSVYALRIYKKMKESPSSNAGQKTANLVEEMPVQAQISPWITPSQIKVGEFNKGVSLTIQF